ncbi:MAG: molecular chaperone HtpG [Sphingobacteriales bacterium]|jgi:molecular chaperone HtpG|nr:molecular chaperone HtpG [Sphingobacteriales bacterium]
MSTTTGKINVQTENIFPIIKKFLYSDHEIFLRELVANAVDASQKFKTLNGIAEKPVETGDLFVEILLDKEARTLTVRDRGVGMNASEVDKYINQIAFSGAEEFVNTYKDQQAAQLIGKFGLGFYSAFMVSSQVELHTRSWQSPSADGVRWSCDGSPEFTLNAEEKADRGTDVVLHISEDALEFLETERIDALLRKYCAFLPVEIRFEGKTINNTAPAWVRKPSELDDEAYKAFYRELYPFAEDPLFWIHLNVDYPFNLTGILYFPRLKKQVEVQKNKIQLYCRQVFVTDSVEGIVPEFLTLLHGVIDSPDIPLNVSRSYLQSDTNVKKISNHILKKVADKLEELFKENRADFEAKWDDIGVFIKYGMLSEEKFFDRARKFCLLKNVDGKYFTFDEYRELIRMNQEDKDKKLVHIYTTRPDEQQLFINAAKAKGYDVLCMDGVLDTHIVNFLEQKLEQIGFVRVDSDTADNLVRNDEQRVSVLDQAKQDELKSLAESQVDKARFTVTMQPLSTDDAPILVTRPEFMRRMKEMSAMGGGYGFMGEMPEQFQLVVNTNHPLMQKVLDTGDAELRGNKLQQAIDLALLTQGLLKGDELSRFLKRSVAMLES